MEHAVLLPNNNGSLPAFNQLELVDYGGNAPMPELYRPELNDPERDSVSALYHHDQFAGWFHLPVLKHLEIWLREITKLNEQPPDLSNLHTLVLARSTIPETDSLQNLHLGLTYPFYCFRKEKVF